MNGLVRSLVRSAARIVVTLIALLLIPFASAVAQTQMQTPAPPAAPANVSVRSSVDRTAIWVADRVTFTVAIRCGKNVDILTDDLSRDRLKLSGLDVIGGDTIRHAEGDETRYEFRYVLTTYRVDLATLTIAPFSVRYYVRRAGMRPEEATPAGSIDIPGASIARRSLLPDDQPVKDIRDGRPAAPRPTLFAMLMPIGVTLILLAAAPVALLGVALGRRLYARRQLAAAAGPSPRQARQAMREQLESVRAADPASADARREAFAQLDALVRQHVRDVSGVPTASLTPAEIATALEPRGARMPIDLVRRVLVTCELARYAPMDHLPPLDAWRDALAEAEQVFAAH